MAEVEIRNPTIKLFGKTIALPLNHAASAYEPSATSVQPAAADDDDDASACKLVSPEITVPKDDSAERRESKKEPSGEELASDKQGDGSANRITDQSTSGISENPSVERETPSQKTSKNEDQSETSNSQDKTLKKPDKILPCPRCNSMDTKFCYYNNYNINQPRHFCKNCQRYWTAGGTMRNVPVGAGRRKNKNSSSSYFSNLMVPDNGVHHHHYLGNNGTFLTFGSDSPISDSVPSASQSCQPSGFHINGDNGDDHSSKSSITASNSSEKGGKTSLQQSVVKNFLPFPPQLPSFPGIPWPYSYSPPVGPPAFCPPGFPVSYYPAAPYWGCTLPPSWSLPSLNHSGQNPFANSSVLGKHSRDGKVINNTDISQNEELVKQKSSETERCLWIPKTLRLDDPNEAAKSSIWCTLGIKNEKVSSMNGGGLFAAFHSKGKEENHKESCSLLQANPAAFSRALEFREIA